MATEVDELDAMGGEYDPRKGVQALRLEVVPDGQYEGEFQQGEYTRLGNKPAVKTVVKIVGGEMDAALVEVTWFLDTVEKLNRFGADMKMLGLPSDQWGKRGKMSSHVAGAVAALCAGKVGFKFGKSSRENAGTGQVYHNVFIFGVVAKSTRMPVGPKGKAPADDDTGETAW